jgi:hypothetical protein
MWQVQKQYIPGNDVIWVAQMLIEDPIHNFDTEAEAQAKADELQAADTDGRSYRVVQI